MTTRSLDDTNHAPPGSPPVANYVYVPTSGDYKPLRGTDNGDGTASQVATVNQGSATTGTPWPVSVATGTISVTNIAALAVINAIDVANYNLQSAAFTQTTNLTLDYLLSRLELAFTTSASRTITVTAVGNGTVLWQQTNTNLSVEVEFDNPAFDAANQINVAITQTASPCLVDVRLAVQEGSSMLGGNPVLGAGQSHIGSVSIDANVNNGSSDAFGKLRISQPFTLIDSSFEYDLDSVYWESLLASGGTVTSSPLVSGATLAVTSTAASRALFQTHYHLRYQPGKAMQMLATGVLGSPVGHQAHRVGFYGDRDGLFFQVAGSGFSQNGYSTAGISVVRRTSTSGSAVDNGVPQASWNLDRLDGTGPSGITLDLTKMQIFVIDFQWLSTGVVRWGFEIDGAIVYCHVEYHANLLTVPYMRTANLPVRYEVVNDATGGNAGSLLAVCSTVVSEGGQEPGGRPFTANSGTTPVGVSTVGVPVPVFSIRPKLTFNGITNRGLVELVQANTSNVQQIVLYNVWRNPTLTGASWLSVDANSIVETDTAATAMTGGTSITSFYSGGNTGAAHAETLDLGKLRLSLNAAGTVADIFTLSASKVSANDAGIYGALSWLEYR